jgi:membrane protein YqaA with SNARE-associated domain
MEITPRIKCSISFVWGFCEASFFFLVPDIWLSRIAMTDFRQALKNTLFATIGALLGGLVVYMYGHAAFEETGRFLGMIPAISPDMIEDAGTDIAENGLMAALVGGIAQGMPYKIYAVWAGHLAISLPLFLLASAVARLIRFFVVAGLFYAAARVLSAHLSAQSLLRLHAAVWILFYAGYFWSFGFIK